MILIASPMAFSETIDLSHWKLTLPVDASNEYRGHAKEVAPKQVASGFTDKHFQVDEEGRLVFWCPVNGARTDNAKYARCELREMLDVDDVDANWQSSGAHTLSAKCRVIEVPSNPKVVIGQIHGYAGKARPLVKLQYFKGRIEALVKSSPSKGKDIVLTFPDIGLNTEIDWEIKLQNGILIITVNGTTQTSNIIESDPDWGKQAFYFKAGVYPQDNDGPRTEGARVVFSELKTSHTD